MDTTPISIAVLDRDLPANLPGRHTASFLPWARRRCRQRCCSGSPGTDKTLPSCRTDERLTLYRRHIYDTHGRDHAVQKRCENLGAMGLFSRRD